LRWFYLAVVVVFVLAMVVFASQNTQGVTVAFLDWAASAPLAAVIFVAYVLGAATGGSLFALLRRSFQRSRRTA
jgi:lipopolysaccharide assembly protein A